MLRITARNPKLIRLKRGAAPALKLNPARRNNKIMGKFIILWFPVLVCTGIIFYASSLPASDIPPLFPFQDIAFHFIIYSMLALFFCRGLRNSRPRTQFARNVFITAVFVFLYALSDEFHQSFVPGRFASGFDVFIDTLGGFTGSLVYKWRK